MTIYLHYRLLISELLPMTKALHSALPFPVCAQYMRILFRNTDIKLFVQLQNNLTVAFMRNKGTLRLHQQMA